jgi:hypothetical protein
MVKIAEDRRWGTPYWGFHWVVDFLIRRIADAEAIDQLRLIDELNLPAVVVDDFSPEVQLRMLESIADQMWPEFEAQFPDLAGKDDIKEWVMELVRLARDELLARANPSLRDSDPRFT